jgi:hypothetical protein
MTKVFQADVFIKLPWADVMRKPFWANAFTKLPRADVMRNASRVRSPDLVMEMMKSCGAVFNEMEASRLLQKGSKRLRRRGG